MRAHPHLYEINTWPWLDALSRRSGRFTTLAGVPDREWDALQRLGIDIVYLMGIWKRSPLGRELARSNLPLFEAFDRALPGWTPRDVAGSAYCIAGYEPDPRIGTWDELAQVRASLHARGMQLMVDFIRITRASIIRGSDRIPIAMSRAAWRISGAIRLRSGSSRPRMGTFDSSRALAIRIFRHGATSRSSITRILIREPP